MNAVFLDELHAALDGSWSDVDPRFPFTWEDVAEAVGTVKCECELRGEPPCDTYCDTYIDGLVRLKDGRRFHVAAHCDTTGWDCIGNRLDRCEEIPQ